MLKFLRRRARISQRDLSIAVGYSESQISRLESNLRPPDLTTLAALFAPALHIEDEPETLARLLELAALARGEAPPERAADSPTGENRSLEAILARLPDVRPGPRHNLPLQLTNFIGRAEQIAEVKRLLQGNRLLTLIGPGGTGKTRLALQAAAEMLDEFPDGAWLVELAPIAQPAQVPQAVAQALALRPETAESFESAPADHVGRDALSLVVDHLRDRSLLLILDNCEHLVGACAQLAEQLLRAAPRLLILTTSREALGVWGESSHPVPALSLPDTGQLPPLETLAQSEAVQLFIERAQAVRPDLALSEENAAAVVQICQRLDGIPLAIELAAARARALSVEQISARLAEHDRLRLLTGGSRTAPPRQQTLRGAIDTHLAVVQVLELRPAHAWGARPAAAAIGVCRRLDVGGGRANDEYARSARPADPIGRQNSGAVDSAAEAGSALQYVGNHSGIRPGKVGGSRRVGLGKRPTPGYLSGLGRRGRA